MAAPLPAQSDRVHLDKLAVAANKYAINGDTMSRRGSDGGHQDRTSPHRFKTRSSAREDCRFKRTTRLPLGKALDLGMRSEVIGTCRTSGSLSS